MHLSTEPVESEGILETLRRFLRTRAGLAAAGTGVLAALLVLFLSLRSLATNEAEQIAANRIFIDSATLKPFAVTLKGGMEIPVQAPSGNKTGYPAEFCSWTRDGQVRPEAFPVLLNSYAGKPEPTFCPDCGRLVVAHNPPAEPGRKPPPTRGEYRAIPRRDR